MHFLKYALLCLLLAGCAAHEQYKPFIFDAGNDYIREGAYRIEDEKGRMGFADETGKVIIKPQFAFAFPFEEGKACVTFKGERQEVPGSGGEHFFWDSDEWYYIDKQGNILSKAP